MVHPSDVSLSVRVTSCVQIRPSALIFERVFLLFRSFACAAGCCVDVELRHDELCVLNLSFQFLFVIIMTHVKGAYAGGGWC